MVLFFNTGFLFSQSERILMPRRNNSPGFEAEVETCAAEFLDSGGVNPYGNNENGILTFCPDLPGDRIQLDFISADIKSGDLLRVYDGNSDQAPLLLTITNITPAGFERTVVRASQRNPQGCLTVTFTSVDIPVANPYEGWFSRVSCFTPEIEPGVPEDLFLSDDPSGDEIEIFDLSVNDEALLNGLPAADFRVSYFASESDALGDFNPLDPIHINNGNPQTIYTRLENPSISYVHLDSFLITVNTIPEIFTVQDLIACDSDSDGKTPIILSEKAEDLYRGRENLTLRYFETPDDALSGRNSLDPDNYINTTNPQEIYYRLINTETDAYALGSFGLQVVLPPDIVAAGEQDSCDDGSGNAFIDLSPISDQITQSQSNLQVSWHRSVEDARAGANPIGTDFSFSGNTTLYARVSDPATGCSAYTQLDLLFILSPETTLQPIYELCPGSPGDAKAVLQTGLDPEAYQFTWFENGIEIQGEQSPSYTSTQAGNYEVRLEEPATGCSFTKTTEVIQALPPEGFEITTRPDSFSKTYEVTLSTGQEIGYLFSLDGGVYQTSGVFSGVLAGSHRLSVATTAGCEVLQTTFSILGYPAFFTPNGDNINEAWSVSSSPEISDMTVSIFNRFGALITVLTEARPEWNGRFNGRDLPSDTYWFRVDYVDNGTARSAKGYFALKR